MNDSCHTVNSHGYCCCPHDNDQMPGSQVPLFVRLVVSILTAASELGSKNYPHPERMAQSWKALYLHATGLAPRSPGSGKLAEYSS